MIPEFPKNKTLENSLKRWIVLLLALVEVACARGRSSGGGVDGGGGELVYASREDVIEVTNQVWSDLTTIRPGNPLIVARDLLESGAGGEEVRVREIMRKIAPRTLDAHTAGLVGGGLTADQAAAFEQLKKKKIQFQENGPCEGPWHKEPAASVSKLNLDGEICVSVEVLKKNAKVSLQANVLALLVHEIVHLHGFGEQDAKLVQSYFLHHLFAILRMDGEHTKKYMFFRFYRVGEAWRPFIRYDQIDERFIDGVLGTWISAFETLKFELKQPESQDNLKLPHPEYRSELLNNIDGAIAAGYALFNHWSEENPGRSSKRVDPRFLEELGACAESGVEAMQSAAIYYLGNTPEKDHAHIKIIFARETIEQSMKPEALTNPDLRFKPDPEDGGTEKLMYPLFYANGPVSEKSH